MLLTICLGLRRQRDLRAGGQHPITGHIFAAVELADGHRVAREQAAAEFDGDAASGDGAA